MTTTTAPESTSSMMPIWVDDMHIDPTWFQVKTGLAGVSSCTVEDVSNQTRRGKHTRDGATLRLTLQYNHRTSKETAGSDGSNNPATVIIKQIPETGLALSQQLGLAREALFYQHLAHDLPEKTAPLIYYSAGDYAKGRKIIVMEDLGDEALDSGIFFGPTNPNNWTRDLPTLVQRAGSPPPSPRDVAALTFQRLAALHATYWQRRDLLDASKRWLRGQAWIRGEGREAWDAAQNLVRRGWSKYLEREKGNKEDPKAIDTIAWDPTLRAAVEKAVRGISWEAQLKRLDANNAACPWTLVHGDCWPGNFMWMLGQETPSIRLLDWEMVGLGSGPQDLGQYVISNMDPVDRRACEKELVQLYYSALKQKGIDCTWDYVWSEYRIGGLERWLWFLVYFLGNGMVDWAKCFHDQMASFMKDHGLTADDVVQPRP